jgi:hypothetical protein
MSPTKKASLTLPIDTPLVCPTAVSITTQPISLNIIDAARMAGVPSWTLRQSVMLGELRAKHCGRTHVVLLRDLQDWLERLDDVEPSTAPSILARKKAS